MAILAVARASVAQRLCASITAKNSRSMARLHHRIAGGKLSPHYKTTRIPASRPVSVKVVFSAIHSQSRKLTVATLVRSMILTVAAGTMQLGNTT